MAGLEEPPPSVRPPGTSASVQWSGRRHDGPRRRPKEVADPARVGAPRAWVVSRDDGFAVMDVSADIVNDPKWRRLQRVAPDHWRDGFIAYVATLGESWKAGRRVTVDDAWPVLMPYNAAAVEAMTHVGLLDRGGRVSRKAWRQWFDIANERRRKSRDRWARYNATRDAVPTSLPRGTNADTATSVPSVPSSRPTEGERDTNPVENGAGPRLVHPGGRTA